MSDLKNEEYYISFWTDVREKLLIVAELDPAMPDKLDLYRNPSRMTFGASSHNYRIKPMSEEEILDLEKQLGLPFPINFRTYLAVIGINTAGPDYGIYDRGIVSNTIENRLKPCPFEARPGIGFASSDDDDDSEHVGDEYSFNFDDYDKGTLEIGTGGNPSTYHLVVSGETVGDIFIFTGDMLFYEGSFETWYTKWLHKRLDELQSGKAKEDFDKTFVPRADRSKRKTP